MRLLAWVITAIFLGTAAQAQGEKAGDFDYYVMSLGWSSNWCALTGDARRDPQGEKTDELQRSGRDRTSLRRAEG